MTVRIVDRRYDSKHKSSVNRSRFLRRFKKQIRKAVSESIDHRSVRDIDNGEKISISDNDINEPQFSLGHDGIHNIIHPGNDRYSQGDEIDRPEGSSGQQTGSGDASDTGEGLDNFVFTLTKEEFLDIFFDELELPRLVKRQLAQLEQFKTVRAGYSQSGVPTNINLERTMRRAAGRRIAIGSPYSIRLRRLERELLELNESPIPCNSFPFSLAHVPEATLIENEADKSALIARYNHEINVLRAKLDALPFIDPFDLRYNNRIKVPQPSTQAVMFCLLDVSGSMDEGRKSIAKRFFMLLYLFLTRNYEHIEVVFIRHHTVASEVDESDFFSSRETGGTVVSSALELMREIIQKRYPASIWNIYGAQASDGDNWNHDSPLCRQILESDLLPVCQYFAYIEITNGPHQNLWEEYEQLQTSFPEQFAMQPIRNVADIYPVFRELFKREV